MRFIDRPDLERVGRSGARKVTDEVGTRGRQLGNFWLYTDPDDSGYTQHALYDGYWESWITLWMDRNVADGSNVLDIGANHGYYSCFLASRGCRVTAVEPQPTLVDLLTKSSRINNFDITVLDVAVCDRLNDTVEMMVPIRHGMNATISNQVTHAPNGHGTIMVHTTTLDNLGAVHGGYDFIKVDAEGAEDLIWAGSSKYREEYPDTLWLMEWRWDRYRTPESFGASIIDNYSVTHVNFDGDEEPIDSIGKLGSRRDEDWMLVIRKK